MPKSADGSRSHHKSIGNSSSMSHDGAERANRSSSIGGSSCANRNHKHSASNCAANGKAANGAEQKPISKSNESRKSGAQFRLQIGRANETSANSSGVSPNRTLPHDHHSRDYDDNDDDVQNHHHHQQQQQPHQVARMTAFGVTKTLDRTSTKSTSAPATSTKHDSLAATKFETHVESMAGTSGHSKFIATKPKLAHNNNYDKNIKRPSEHFELASGSRGRGRASVASASCKSADASSLASRSRSSLKGWLNDTVLPADAGSRVIGCWPKKLQTKGTELGSSAAGSVPAAAVEASVACKGNGVTNVGTNARVCSRASNAAAAVANSNSNGANPNANAKVNIELNLNSKSIGAASASSSGNAIRCVDFASHKSSQSNLGKRHYHLDASESQFELNPNRAYNTANNPANQLPSSDIIANKNSNTNKSLRNNTTTAAKTNIINLVKSVQSQRLSYYFRSASAISSSKNRHANYHTNQLIGSSTEKLPIKSTPILSSSSNNNKLASSTLVSATKASYSTTSSKPVKHNYKLQQNNTMADQAVLDKLEAGYAKLQAATPEQCHSLLKKHLTREVLDQLKSRKTAMGATLLDVAQSGFENLDSGVGVYAPDAESYTLFAELFNPIIQDYHGGFKPTDKHPASDFGDLETLVNVDPDNQYVISTRVRCGRSLKGYPFNPCLTEAQYKEMESKVSSTLKEMSGDLAGQYHPLTGMTKETQQKLIDDHFLFKEGDRFLQAANACRYWPTGRGIYHNDAKTFLVWVNEEDHLRIISMQMGGDLKQVFGRLVNAVKTIEAKVPFSRDDRLGFLTFCPTNLGTTIRASVHIKLPKLAADRKKLEEVASRYNLQVRGTSGEHTESVGGVYDISNKRRLGLTEYQAVREMQDGILELIKIEKSL